MKVLKLFLLLFFFVGLASAEQPGEKEPQIKNPQESPELLLKHVISEVKRSGALTPIGEYVHWETEFKTMKPRQRQLLEIESTQDLKERFYEFFQNPDAFVTHLINGQRYLIPEEFRADLEQEIKNGGKEHVKQGLIHAVTSHLKRLQSLSIEIVGIKVDKDLAEADLALSGEAVEPQMKVKMIRDQNKWWFASSGVFN